jgi:glycosyltransferase involved in cell wall biosynthesis
MISVGFGVTQLSRGQLQNNLDGIGHYSFELLNALNHEPEVSLELFSFGSKPQEDLAGQSVKLLNSFRIEVLKGLLFPPYRMHDVKGCSVDLIHATDHLTPYVKGVPLVATLMDAIPLVHPHWVGTHHSTWNKTKNYFWKKMARRSNQVITCSEYSKKEISEHFEIALDKISVVPLGVNHRFFDRVSAQSVLHVLQSFQINQPFFLHVGTLQPRKNIERLLAAMRALPELIRKTHCLVIVGRLGWGCDALEDEIARAEKAGWCCYLKYVSDLELRALLQSAKALMIPSLAEGFGLPVLEGFASRVPVLTSNTTSLPEVSQGASLMFDPMNVDEIMHAMMSVINEPEKMAALVSRGYTYAKQMSWKQCAQGTLAVYKKALSS